MTAMNENVVYLRPADHGSMRHLALGMGNGTRLAEAHLSDAQQAAAALTALAAAQSRLSDDAAGLARELAAVLSQIERCQAMWADSKES